MELKHNNFLGTTNEKFHLDDCAVSVVQYTKPVSEDWHCHEDIHLSLILQGGNQESRKHKDLQVTSGKIMAYDQGEVHRNRFTAHPSKNLNLEFKSEFFQKNDLAFEHLNLSGPKMVETYLDLIQVYNELRINDIYSADSIQSALIRLFAREEVSTKPIWLDHVREMIEDRWNEFIALDELAAEFNVHPVTISKYFKKYYQVSLGDYMRKVKIKNAIHLLHHTNLSLTEIAFTCGFSDQSHMTRMFKLYVAITPKYMRN